MEKRSFWPKVIGCGCLAVIVLVGALVGGLYWMMSVGEQEIVPSVEAFLDLAENGRYEEAYLEAADPWRSGQSLEDTEAFFRAVGERLGARQSLECSGLQVGATLGGPKAFATFSADYERGHATLTATLRKYGEDWRVVAINYTSNALLQEAPR